jgi:hypothetical protein
MVVSAGQVEFCETAQAVMRPIWVCVRLRTGGRARLRDGPSLYPSVDFESNYRCHFWLHDGLATV